MDMTFFRAALLGACVLLSGCDSATTPATPTATYRAGWQNDGHLLAGQRHWRG